MDYQGKVVLDFKILKAFIQVIGIILEVLYLLNLQITSQSAWMQWTHLLKYPCQPLSWQVPYIAFGVSLCCNNPWTIVLYVQSLGEQPFPPIFSSSSLASSISPSLQSPLIITAS